MRLIILGTLIVVALSWTAHAPGSDPVFGHLTDEEWAQQYLMPIDPMEDPTPPKYMGGLDGTPVLDDFDWRDDNKYGHCISPIRDQGACGSCWAFATSEVAQDKWCFATQEEITFSPQHLMDCDTKESGCAGAVTDRVIFWIEDHELVEDKCYPYHAKVETCDLKGCPEYHMKNARTYTGSKATIDNIVDDLVANGPLYFSMQVYADLKNYDGGVYVAKTSLRSGGHAVEVVGYGEMDKDDPERIEGKFETTHYWIIANSWGMRWGEGGYFRIRMDQNIAYKAGTFEADLDRRPQTATPFSSIVF